MSLRIATTTLLAGLALTAVSAYAGTLTEDFEGSSNGSTTPPGDWAYFVVDADPQAGYVTTTGNGGGLGGQITGNNAGNSNSIVGAYIANTAAYVDLSASASGSFDFNITNIGNYSNMHFMLGDIADGITETTPGELISLKLMKNTFGNRGGIFDGAGGQLATDNTQQLAADTWYSATWSWTPTSGTTGDFSYTANSITSTTVSYTFDSAQGYVGFGAAGYYGNDTLGTVDNISITSTTIPEPGSLALLGLGGLLVARRRRA